MGGVEVGEWSWVSGCGVWGEAGGAGWVGRCGGVWWVDARTRGEGFETWTVDRVEWTGVLIWVRIQMYTDQVVVRGGGGSREAACSPPLLAPMPAGSARPLLALSSATDTAPSRCVRARVERAVRMCTLAGRHTCSEPARWSRRAGRRSSREAEAQSRGSKCILVGVEQEWRQQAHLMKRGQQCCPWPRSTDESKVCPRSGSPSTDALAAGGLVVQGQCSNASGHSPCA